LQRCEQLACLRKALDQAGSAQHRLHCTLRSENTCAAAASGTDRRDSWSTSAAACDRILECAWSYCAATGSSTAAAARVLAALRRAAAASAIGCVTAVARPVPSLNSCRVKPGWSDRRSALTPHVYMSQTALPRRSSSLARQSCCLQGPQGILHGTSRAAQSALVVCSLRQAAALPSRMPCALSSPAAFLPVTVRVTAADTLRMQCHGATAEAAPTALCSPCWRTLNAVLRSAWGSAGAQQQFTNTQTNILPPLLLLPRSSRYAFAAIDRQASCVASPRLALAAPATWQGVLVHELGHCIDFETYGQ
jgi:hypothetical protein